jgi:hypothetical protein
MASLFLFVEHTSAKTEDTYSFCSNTCRGQACNNVNTKQECKSKCLDGDMWKRIAATELNASGENYKKEGDPLKKSNMLYDTQIATCLDITSKTHQSVPEPDPTFQPTPVADKSTNNDLCAAAMAAVSQEINLGSSNHNLFNIMEDQVGQ